MTERFRLITAIPTFVSAVWRGYGSVIRNYLQAGNIA